MKIMLILALLTLSNNSFAFDLKGKLLEVAKDKKNQEQAKEIVQKGIEYIKSDKADEAKPEVVPTPAPSPVAEKEIKKVKHKKAVKKN